MNDKVLLKMDLSQLKTQLLGITLSLIDDKVYTKQEAIKEILEVVSKLEVIQAEIMIN